MSTGDPIVRFKEIMQNLETLFENDQKDDDVKNRAANDACDSDLGAFNNDNNLLIRRLVEIQTVLDRLNPQLKKTTEVLN